MNKPSRFGGWASGMYGACRKRAITRRMLDRRVRICHTSGEEDDMAAQARAQIASTVALPLEDQIRQRAYAIYLERGAQDGSDLDDWLQAEEEILSHHPPEASAIEAMPSTL